MTAASIQLDIAKMALQDANTRSSITALNDGSPEAVACQLYYGYVRDQALRASRWNFAKRSAILAVWKAMPGTPEATTSQTTTGLWAHTYPTPPWIYSYVLTGDYLYARRVIGQGTSFGLPAPPIYPYSNSFPVQVSMGAPFEISNDNYGADGIVLVQSIKILDTNQENALLEYTYQANDEIMWDGMFVQTMVSALSARLAIAVSGDKGLAQLRTEQANNTILQARVTAANESLTILDHVPDWMRIRGVGSPVDTDYIYPYGPLFTMSL